MTNEIVTKSSDCLSKRFARHQAGQALPLGIAFALVGVLGAFVLFNTGQVAVDKQRLANAADSAAYSGMVWQARALNFQAYTNRAMVANQVSIGQAVSLHSWADYAETSTGNYQKVLGGVPYLGQFVSAMDTVVTVLANAIRPIAEGMVSIIGPINQAVGATQQAMYASSFVATPDIVRNITSASDPRFTADTAYSAIGIANNLTDWTEYTQEYTSEDNLVDMQERTDLINDSRDNFSEARYWDFFDGFWIYSTPFTKHKIFKEGETRLVMDVDGSGEPEWEWMAKDTLALDTKIWRGWKGTKTVEIPMGWGAAYANENGSGADSMVMDRCRSNIYKNTESCKYRDRNNKTEKLANYELASLDSYTGVNTFRSISETVRNPEEGEPVLKLKTEVSMDLDEVVSSDTLVTSDGLFTTPMVSPANKLSSISVAEVYYRRPEAYESTIDAKKFEHANGYNPYWEVRLAPVESADRLVALTLRGDLGTSSTLPGGESSEALANYDPAAGSSSESTDGEETGETGETGDTVLASYEAATLNSVMDVSEDAVSALIDAAPPGLDLDNIDGFVGNIDGYMDAAGIKDIVEERIKEEVENAAQAFLENAFKSALEQHAPEALGTIQAAEAEIENAQELADELSQQLENLRIDVGNDFRAALEEQADNYELDLQPLTDLVGPLEDDLIDLNDQINGAEDVLDSVIAERDRVQGELDDIQEDMDELLNDLQTELTGYLIDRVDHYAGDLLGDLLPWEDAFDITTFIIEDYLLVPAELRDETTTEDPADLLGWGEEDDV